MPRWYIILALAALTAVAQEPPTSLTKEQISAAEKEQMISIPMPGELFAALGKTAKPDWAAFFRKPIPTNFTSRQQIAMNLGGLIADGYLAVEAADGQQVKNVARDVKTLANALGVGQDLLNRGNSISEFAENNQWDALKEELEAAQNEVIAAMKAHNDQELVTFVALGGWARGTEVVTAHIARNYSPDSARILRQPGIARTFVNRLAAMPEKVTDNPVVKRVRLTLFEIHKAVAFPSDQMISAEAVNSLHTLAATMVKDITLKDL
jgi:hypothetical protein